MMLADLIRGKSGVATAAPATSATVQRVEAQTVATVATVAVAARPTPVLPHADAIPRAWWRVHYLDRGWREVCFAPSVTRDEALLLHQDATDAVPGWD